jgi:hypothetical protein
MRVAMGVKWGIVHLRELPLTAGAIGAFRHLTTT